MEDSLSQAKALALVLLVVMPAAGRAAITAIWANSGDEKIPRDDLRAASGANVLSTVWDGSTIRLFGARNEIVSFNLVLEAESGASNVQVSFDRLEGPQGAAIRSIAAKGDGVFNWTRRDIELFYVRYLQIKGLSLIANSTYDERLIPERFRRPWTLSLSGRADGKGTWADRPDHDKSYPEIAVPLELISGFHIPPKTNQSVWADIYIPKRSPAGIYRGRVQVRVQGKVVRTVPVVLKVRSFSLPDVPSAKTMLMFSAADINKRFFGEGFPSPGTTTAVQASHVRDLYFLLAHRHRISLIGEEPGNDCPDAGDQPCPDWLPRLDGKLFTAGNGYGGPGVGVGNGVYSIGTYGSWSWKNGGEAQMRKNADRWVDWFKIHAPSTEYFLYLADESSNIQEIEQWASWIAGNPGVGKQLRSLATIELPKAADQAPSLDIPTSTLGQGVPGQWEPLDARYEQDARKRFFMYNGHRPGSGSFATEDDGVALRELAWGQFKKGINRWFYWQSTYYNDYQHGAGDTDVFSQARTYGGAPKVLEPNLFGETTASYGNGDGVLFYPGTDRVFPANSYGVDGPFASLRLKYWRRGIQDVDYLTLAQAHDPAAVRRIVDEMAPKVLWEYGVHDPSDPTYQYADISWPVQADAWEKARAQLAEIIERP